MLGATISKNRRKGVLSMDIRDKLREHLGRAFIDEAKVQALVCYAQYTEDNLEYNCDIIRGESMGTLHPLEFT